MTSATTPKTIDLGGGQSVQREAVAAGDITPGDLVETNADGAVIRHDDADNIGAPAFAVEFDLTGRNIDDAYASGDQVVYRTFPQGAHVYANLASGQNVAKGALLTSNGGGKMKAAGSTSYNIAEALEAVDASAAEKRIRVRILLGKAAAGAE